MVLDSFDRSVKPNTCRRRPYSVPGITGLIGDYGAVGTTGTEQHDGGPHPEALARH